MVSQSKIPMKKRKNVLTLAQNLIYLGTLCDLTSLRIVFDFL